MYTRPFNKVTMEDQWATSDDRVMGGASYSYFEYENGYGKFYGDAVAAGGGFSKVSSTDFSKDNWAPYVGADKLMDWS